MIHKTKVMLFDKDAPDLGIEGIKPKEAEAEEYFLLSQVESWRQVLEDITDKPDVNRTSVMFKRGGGYFIHTPYKEFTELMLNYLELEVVKSSQIKIEK